MNNNRPKQGRFSIGMLLYNLLLVLLAPAIFIYIVLRLLRGKSRDGLAERLGILPESVLEHGQSEDGVIWVQAVSVGEVNAVAPILRELRLRFPLARIILSVTTPTGRAVAEKRDLDADAVMYFPFDLPIVVQRVFRQLRPMAYVMVETELWPNCLATARQMNVATVVINGRISDRAYGKMRFFRPIYRWTMSHIDAVCAQSVEDAERFISLGAPRERVSVGGNSKFDEAFSGYSAPEGARWRQEFGFPQDAPVIVAGSTHEGEDELVLSIFDTLRLRHQNLQLVIAPRHPERGEKVHAMVQEHGYDVYRRSHMRAAQGEDIPGRPAGESATIRVVILDTVGELTSVYNCADIVFVGGSLIKGLSGHNILEAISLGKPTLYGPYMNDFRDISAIALRESCGIQVANADELREELGRLLSSPQERLSVQERGSNMVEKYAGASRRYAEAIEKAVESRLEADEPSV